jgi:hypothetical protein
METNINTSINEVKKECADIFLKKMHDYGPAWRVMRNVSITDQIFIKVQRIRSIREKKTQKIKESIDGDLMAILNYSAIGLIQMDLGETNTLDNGVAFGEISDLYEKHVRQTDELAMLHPGNEIWDDWRVDSFVDTMLQELLYLRSRENGKVKIDISVVRRTTYYRLIKYSALAYVRLKETN